MDIIHELTRKPWLEASGKQSDRHKGQSYALTVEKVGLRVFLAVVTVVFTLVVVVYGDRMVLSDWRPIPEPWLLWLNTVLLVLASVTFHRALTSARRGQIDGVRTGLYAAGVCTSAFLVGQLWVGQQLADLGYFADTSPSLAFFYLITGLHGLHLFGGLVAWARTTVKMWRGREVAVLLPSIELCAIYWHYMLGLWVVLFGLLVLT